jgi:hypothetical protein
MSATEQPPTGRPYRSPPPKTVRFICTVCFATGTTDEAGVCSCSGAPRLPLANAEVADMVRARVAAVRRKRSGWKIGLAVATAILVALGVCVVLGWQILPESHTGNLRSNSAFTTLAFVLAVVGIGVVTLTEKKAPTDAAGMVDWLRVKVEP